MARSSSRRKPQEVFALILDHLVLRLGGKLFLNLQDLDFVLHQAAQNLKASDGIVAVQHLLLLIGADGDVLGDEISQRVLVRLGQKLQQLGSRRLMYS